MKAGAFWPQPEVDSAVIRIDVNDPATADDEAVFFRVARAGFSEKRKQLENNLKQLGDEAAIAAALVAAGVDGRCRSETLALGEWRALVAALYT